MVLYYIQLYLIGSCDNMVINFGAISPFKCDFGEAAFSEAAGSSFLPGTHVSIDGHTVVGSITQLLLTNLCTEAKNRKRERGWKCEI